MSAVLIDNWNLVNAAITKDIKGNNIPNAAYSDLISALVLWDEVYYLYEGFSDAYYFDEGFTKSSWWNEKKL